MDPCYPPPSSVHLELEPSCTYETPIVSSTDSIHAIRDSLNPSLADPSLQSSTLQLEPEPCTYETLVSSTEGIRDSLKKALADLGEVQSDYQMDIKELKRFVVLVRLRYALLTNKGRSRFCARTSMQQRSGVNS